MNPQDFEYLKDFLKSRSGIVLSADKLYLVESRLTPVARDLGMSGIDELISTLQKTADESLKTRITDAMTTNESFFFRDQTPFDNLKDHVLPPMIAARKAKGQNRIRIWSAACSSGQEPYTIAMMLLENKAKFGDMSFEILATDLSTEIVDKAKEGAYSQFEVQRGLPIQLLVKYFTQTETAWQISEDIRKMVRFQTFNLLDSYGVLGKFDIIFCRNVLIYFDQDTKGAILGRMSDISAPDASLFLGGAESVIGITSDYQPVSGVRGVYQLASATAAAGAAPISATGGR
ncbi:MAG: chemotaxis protein methyltransferase CheR [Paracoccaceae bacterium]|jgi:chemotaxis protein methyltransferase CheR